MYTFAGVSWTSATNNCSSLYLVRDVGQLTYFPRRLGLYEVYPDIFVNAQVNKNDHTAFMMYPLHTVVQVELTAADMVVVNTRDDTHQLNVDFTGRYIVVTFCL